MIEVNIIFNINSHLKNKKSFFKLNKIIVLKFISILFLTFFLIISGLIYYTFYKYTVLIRLDENLSKNKVYTGILVPKNEMKEMILLLNKNNIKYKINEHENILKVRSMDLDKSCDIYIYEYKKYNISQ